MHKYITTRGVGRFTRRIIEDLEDIYFERMNIKTKKKIGMIGLGVREIRVFELVYPKGGTKVLKEKIKIIQKRHPWVSIAFGPSKRDKFVDGVEFL